MNKLFILLIGLAIVSVNPTYAQSEKKLAKCWKVFNEKDYTKGIEKLNKLMDKEWKKGQIPTTQAYNLLVRMEYINYLYIDDIFSDLDDEENFDGYSKDELIELNFTHFIDICRESTILSYSSFGDIFLRQLLVDYDPDTLVSDEAIEFFEEGEKHFSKEDFELAELSYRKALDVDSSYYAAMLYLGDSFWAKKDYDSAIVYYTKAKNMCPDLLEPRKYIVDALMEQELYYRARIECMEALCVYPGMDMKQKMNSILAVENKWMYTHRITRFYYPNDVSERQTSAEGVWYDYRKARKKVKEFCSDEGIIGENEITDERYLEVYSYKYMLEKNEGELPGSMEFAQKMMEDGYLEPYVFLSQFHVDIYDQFKDYMASEENREKTYEFIEKYLIEPIPGDW